MCRCRDPALRATLVGMNGLYALKPWFAARLAGVRRFLIDHDVRPATLTWASVGFGCAAGAALAFLPPGPVAGATVAVFLILRLACANLDGGLARESNRASRGGFVLNEVGDRLAELAVLAGCLAAAPASAVLAAALAATLPSWIALAGAAAGASRRQGGPAGKTERCAQFVLLALTGASGVVLTIMVVASVVTAALRWRAVAVELRNRERGPSELPEPSVAARGGEQHITSIPAERPVLVPAPRAGARS